MNMVKKCPKHMDLDFFHIVKPHVPLYLRMSPTDINSNSCLNREEASN